MKILPVDEFDHVFIYNKGNTEVSAEVIKCCKRSTIIALPNVGKCDHTYLHHILTNYHTLADITVFLPGCCDDRVKWFNTMVTVTVALYIEDTIFVAHEYKEGVRSHFFSLYMDSYESRDKRNRELVNEENTQQKSGAMLASPIRPFGLWYASHFPNVDVNHVAYFGIFAASKKHIMNRTFDSYVDFYKYVNTHANPEVGHYFERSWLAMFHPVAPEGHVYPIPDNNFYNYPPPDVGDDGQLPHYTFEKLVDMLGLPKKKHISHGVV